MMTDRIRIIVVSAIVVLAIGVFSTTVVHAVLYAPDTEVQVPSLAQTAPARAAAPDTYPSRLQIPSLGIDAAVLQVGVGKTGNMAVPPNFTDVGWYKYGTVPGQMGSAVMDGHVDNGLSLDGVFKHLNNLAIGDDLYVMTAGGTRLHFIVSDVQTYPYNAVPLDTFFLQKDTKRLNLITCEGAWVEGQKTYDHRLVIYSTLVP